MQVQFYGSIQQRYLESSCDCANFHLSKVPANTGGLSRYHHHVLKGYELQNTFTKETCPVLWQSCPGPFCSMKNILYQCRLQAARKQPSTIASTVAMWKTAPLFFLVLKTPHYMGGTTMQYALPDTTFNWRYVRVHLTPITTFNDCQVTLYTPTQWGTGIPKLWSRCSSSCLACNWCQVFQSKSNPTDTLWWKINYNKLRTSWYGYSKCPMRIYQYIVFHIKIPLNSPNFVFSSIHTKNHLRTTLKPDLMSHAVSSCFVSRLRAFCSTCKGRSDPTWKAWDTNWWPTVAIGDWFFTWVLNQK